MLIHLMSILAKIFNDARYCFKQNCSRIWLDQDHIVVKIAPQLGSYLLNRSALDLDQSVAAVAFLVITPPQAWQCIRPGADPQTRQEILRHMCEGSSILRACSIDPRESEGFPPRFTETAGLEACQSSLSCLVRFESSALLGQAYPGDRLDGHRQFHPGLICHDVSAGNSCVFSEVAAARPASIQDRRHWRPDTLPCGTA